MTHLYDYRACPTCYCTQRWITHFTRMNVSMTVYIWIPLNHECFCEDMSQRNLLFGGTFHVIEITSSCYLLILVPLLFVLFELPLEKRSQVSTALTQMEQTLYNVSSFLNLFPNTVATKIESSQDLILHVEVNMLIQTKPSSFGGISQEIKRGSKKCLVGKS